jgi:hypothetical protein
MTNGQKCEVNGRPQLQDGGSRDLPLVSAVVTRWNEGEVARSRFLVEDIASPFGVHQTERPAFSGG